MAKFEFGWLTAIVVVSPDPSGVIAVSQKNIYRALNIFPTNNDYFFSVSIQTFWYSEALTVPPKRI